MPFSSWLDKLDVLILLLYESREVILLTPSSVKLDSFLLFRRPASSFALRGGALMRICVTDECKPSELTFWIGGRENDDGANS